MFNINSGSSPQSDTVENESSIVNQRRLCDSADHSNTRPTSLLSRWSVRVEQTTDYRPWSAIHFIFQIQT